MVGILKSARIEWRRRFPAFLRSPTFELVTPDSERHALDASVLPPAGDSSFHLRAAGSRDRVNALTGTTRLREGLAYFLREEPLAILFDLGEGPWQVPWELMLHGISGERARANFIPIRVAGGRLAPSSVRSVDQLRVLILHGDPGELEWRINPKKEADGVVDAWSDLPDTVKSRIAQPIVAPLDAAALPALLTRHRPHILWYCGHGRAHPRAQLLQAPDLWVDAAVLASAVPQEPPLACVLWACELGEKSPDMVAPAPAIHEALRARGVGLTLAMQSRVADRIARAMARTFFESLAIGLSVERASAAARRSALALPQTNPDWGSPALWTTREPVATLSWRDAPDDDLLHNLLSWASVRLARKTPDADATDEEARKQARAWLNGRRVLVRADTLAEATLAELGRVAAAIDELGSAPLFIRMRGTSVTEGLADWAGKVLDWVAPEQLPTPLGQALALASSRDPTGAIKKILACPGVALVLIDPPAELDRDWRHLFERGEDGAPVIIVGPSPDESAWPGWARADLLSTVNRAALVGLHAKAGAMLTALAVLDMALPERHLRDLGFDRALVPEGSGLLFETRAGPMLSAAARPIVLELSNDAMVRDAHRASADLLARLGGGEELEFERLRHLAAIGSGEALEVGGGLIERFAQNARHASVLRAFELLKPLGSARYDLLARRLLAVARAWVVLGEARKADFVLGRLLPQTPLEAALAHALQSEVEKMLGRPGWRDRALREIERAIEIVQPLLASADPDEAEAARTDLVRWQMNRARVRQYLFYDRHAADDYREIIATWEGDEGLGHTVAVAARNLAEAIAFAADGDPSALQESELELNRAEQLLANAPNDPLLAEIAYERVKLAERRHADPAARLGLFEACIKTARRVGHHMVEAIATARRFRTLEDFDAATWGRIERSLEDYGSHGWAFRVAANGRLHAARPLAAAGDRAAAAAELARNLERLETRPAFDSGTDRDRMALTLAGLISLAASAEEQAGYEQEAAKLPWLAEWLAARGVADLKEAWRG